MRFSTALLLWTLVGLSWSARAQEAAKQVTLTWTGKELIFPKGGQGRQVPTFKNAAYETGQWYPSFGVLLPGYVTAVTLQNAQYGPFAAAELATYKNAPEPDGQIKLRHGTESHQPMTQALIPAVRRSAQTGQLEKLLSFSYTYQTGAAPQARTTRNYASASALRTGSWYKIGVTNTDQGTGSVYKLDKTFLRNLGLNVQGMDPRKLQLFGYGLGMLPQANSADRPDDLAENAIYFADNGSNNATFDDDEYFLFYSRGPHTWTYENSRFNHSLNLYTDTTYYFLTVGNGNGRRIAPQPAVSGTPTATITEYTDHFFYERELVNLLKSGRQWLGEGFITRGSSREFTIGGINNIVPGSQLQVTSAVAASSLPGPARTPTTFSITLNGSSLGIQSVRAISCDPATTAFCYPEVANNDVTVFSTTATSASDLRFNYTYSGSPVDGSAAGYLDYIEVQARRRLQLSGRPMEFRSVDNLVPNAISAFEVQSAPSNLVVWDVTSPRDAQSVPHTNGRFLARTSSLREYVAFSPSGSFDTPRAFGTVANQNLHSYATASAIDLIIVSPPVFAAQAQRLADYRLEHDQLKSVVVTPQQIYNEFSSGGQDVTAIRDFVKMIYERPTGRAGRLFVLLFGDASFDYKSDRSNDVTKLPTWWTNRQITDAQNQNFVPTYEANSSFDKVGANPSFCSDDYYGFLDDSEGTWSEDSQVDVDLMDAAIGRLPIRFPVNQPGSAAEAENMVTKLLSYDDVSTQGKWRNRLTFVADDGDYNDHLFAAERTANSLTLTQPGYQVGKVYLDMYPQISSAGSQTSPEANKALDASIEQGSLLVSYAGHGGPKGWMQEGILTNASVLRLQNTSRLTFMFTGTCDFAWYDDPTFNSAGEEILTDTRAGSIGLLTTTRLVYAFNNQALANRFYEGLFRRNPSTGVWPRIGDAVVYGKNNDGIDVANRNFTLLGDPSMRLAMPYYAVRTSRIFDAQTNRAIDTLRALQRVQLEGEVVHPVTNAPQAAFNGEVQVTVYEKPSVIRTLGNESDPENVTVQKDVVYDGKATVTNGRFKVNFIVPKDINYSFGLGKINYYAYSAQAKIDGQGSDIRTTIGGASSTALNDTIPPLIRLFMNNDSSFVFGGLTPTSSTMLGMFSDDSGINTAGTGIGHELTATLDNDPSKVTVLNEYYTARLNSFRSGTVRYLFKDLSVGPHVLRVKAWDTFNNSAEKEIEFIAAKDEKLALDHILNYPNPFAGHTTFHFDHNFSGREMDVQVQIFTISGKLVRTLSANVTDSPSHVASITWNGRDEYNDQLARGVYVYRLSVRTPDGSHASKFEKLVLLN